jgi:hypothetical protein
MTTTAPTFLAPQAQSRDYLPLLKWLLVIILTAFGFLVLWYFGLVQTMVELDRTKVSVVILGIFALTSIHCMYQTFVVSRELVATRRVRDAIVAAEGQSLSIGDDGRVVTSLGQVLEPSVATAHIQNLVRKARASSGANFDQTLLLRSLADQLKAREKLGWFVSESLLRLALLGTAVGFILMLIPLAKLDAFDVQSLRTTLAGMSDGMAIALNITVAGIATALLLKFQYYLLDEGIADLFREVTDVTEVHVIPTFEPKPDVSRAEPV